jgi:hypothetical protein
MLLFIEKMMTAEPEIEIKDFDQSLTNSTAEQFRTNQPQFEIFEVQSNFQPLSSAELNRKVVSAESTRSNTFKPFPAINQLSFDSDQVKKTVETLNRDKTINSESKPKSFVFDSSTFFNLYYKTGWNDTDVKSEAISTHLVQNKDLVENKDLTENKDFIDYNQETKVDDKSINDFSRLRFPTYNENKYSNGKDFKTVYKSDDTVDQTSDELVDQISDRNDEVQDINDNTDNYFTNNYNNNYNNKKRFNSEHSRIYKSKNSLAFSSKSDEDVFVVKKEMEDLPDFLRFAVPMKRVGPVDTKATNVVRQSYTRASFQ